MRDFLSEFLDELTAKGFAPSNPSEIGDTDGKWKNYRLVGDRKNKPHGAYRLTVDADGAVGQFKDRRIEETHTWSSRAAKELSAEEKAAYRAKLQKMREDDARRRAEEYDAAAAEAKEIWQACQPALDHPYLRRKGIGAHGARLNADGELVLPRYDFSGKLWSIQTINADGEKKFQTGGKSSGAMMPIAEKDDDKSVICIAEGFATAASIREATGFPVIVAFTAGNLQDVAKSARKKYPDARFVICADNDAFSFKAPRAKEVAEIDKDTVKGDDPLWDEWRGSGWLFNTGIEKGMAAGHAINAAVIWPEFLPEDLTDKPTDFNDYHKLYGLAALDKRIRDALIENGSEQDNGSEQSVAVIEGPPLDFYESGDFVPDYTPNIDWMQRVVFKNERTGELNKDYVLHNAEVLLTHKPPVGGTLCWDEFLCKMTVVKPLPWDDADRFVVREIDSQDINRLRIWLEGAGIKVDKGAVKDIAELACMNRTINPAVTYLDGLKWDGTERLNKWLAYYLGAESQPAEYLARVGACWLIAAAKRIYSPGTPFHHMLVLEGGQAAMKSTTLATLATFGRDNPITYFSDRVTFEMIDKQDFASYAAGNVILEFQELSGMNKKDRNKVKQWITQTHDEYRKPYDPVPTKYPRKFVLAGTTNESQYLNDPTGDRRFWPVRVGKIDMAALKRDREQLWAEAALRHKAGDLWYITPDDPVYRLMQNEQSARYSGDPWDGVIDDYIALKNIVTVEEIFKEVLHIEKGRWDSGSKSRICNVLVKAGFESKVYRDPATKKTVRRWVRPNVHREDLLDGLDGEEIAF